MIARWRLRRIARRRLREMLPRDSHERTRSPARVCSGVLRLHGQGGSDPREPVGCCCTYGDCRERFTQEECASEGEFQGWTYTWHNGECSAQDVYPAPDYVPSSR